MADNKSLNLSVLKSSLLDTDDFGLLENTTKEIDSIESLDAVPAKDDTNPDKDNKDLPEITDNIEEIEDELPTSTPNPKETTVTGKGDKSANTSKQADLLKVFGSNLADKGLLKFDEAEFDKAEDKDAYFTLKAEEAVKDGVEEGIRTYKSELPEEIDKLVELHKSGVPIYRILESDARIASLEGIKPADIESDVALQKDILTELLTVQGFSKEKIDLKLKRAEDLGTLKDDSVEGFDVLLNIEKTERQNMIKEEQAKKVRADQERVDSLKKIEDSITTSDEIIPGFKLTPEDKKILINGITKSAGTDPKTGRQINALSKARLDDPKMDLKVAYFTLILKGDLSKLENKAASKVTRSLKSVVDSNEPITGSSQAAGDQQRATGINKDVAKSALKYLRRQS